jgi:hypothetical protein
MSGKSRPKIDAAEFPALLIERVLFDLSQSMRGASETFV